MRPTRLLCLLLAAGCSIHAAAVPGAALEREADVQLDVLNVVLDAPWRVWLRPGATIPVMAFFPEADRRFPIIEVTRLAISDAGVPGNALLFEDAAGSGPQALTSPSGLTGEGLTLVDAWGRPSTALGLVSGLPAPGPDETFRLQRIDDQNRGWHVILRVPIPPAVAGRGRQVVTLTAEVTYRRPGEERRYTVRKKLPVELDPDPLPCFPGWRLIDTHVHSIAEFDTGSSFKSLRRNFGGPVQMMQETAQALGLLAPGEGVRGRLLVTDHSHYLADRQFPHWGPTAAGLGGGVAVSHPEWASWFIDPKLGYVAEGQREFENYEDIFGETRGEELSLQKNPGGLANPVGSLAAHILLHGTRHFTGPFHGGYFAVWREENPNRLDRVLERLVTDPYFPRGFAYAAHPFTDSDSDRRFGTTWTHDQVALAVKGPFVRRSARGLESLPFKGFELWNEKFDRQVTTDLSNMPLLRRLLEDPSSDPGWATGVPDWDHSLNIGLQQYHQLVCDSFSQSVPGQPDVRHVRKLYMVAGSDAHGDFNHGSDISGRGFAVLPYPLNTLFDVFIVHSNAFARVRTAVDAEGAGPEAPQDEAGRRMHAYAHGHAVATDGPVLEFAVDADGHLDGTTLERRPGLAWRDADGRIGGDGRMDGARTALVALGSAEPLVRWRWKSTQSAGGALERIELYRDEPGKTVKLVSVPRVTGPAPMLPADGHLPVGPGDGSWLTAPLSAVSGGPSTAPGAQALRVPTAVSLAGFTHRTTLPPFDHRCFTNPIWLLPVQATAATASTERVLPPGSVTAELRFPISMHAVRPRAWLAPLDAAGATTGARIPLVPATGTGWSANPRENLADSVLTLVTAGPVDRSATAGGRRFALVLKDPEDAFANRLNSLCWVIDSVGGAMTPSVYRKSVAPQPDREAR